MEEAFVSLVTAFLLDNNEISSHPNSSNPLAQASEVHQAPVEEEEVDGDHDCYDCKCFLIARVPSYSRPPCALQHFPDTSSILQSSHHSKISWFLREIERFPGMFPLRMVCTLTWRELAMAPSSRPTCTISSPPTIRHPLVPLYPKMRLN